MLKLSVDKLQIHIPPRSWRKDVNVQSVIIAMGFKYLCETNMKMFVWPHVKKFVKLESFSLMRASVQLSHFKFGRFSMNLAKL